MPEEGNVEWNIAGHRIQYIGSLVNEIRQQYAKASHSRDREEVRKYFTLLKTLFQDIRLYIDEEQEKELREKMTKLSRIINGRSPKIAPRAFQEFEKFDNKLQKERQKAGLDIPREIREEEGEKMTGGRNW